MSTATVTKVVVPKPRQFEVISTVPKESSGPQPIQENPFFPVVVAALISFFLSTAAIGSIFMWIFLRHSGVFPFESFGR